MREYLYKLLTKTKKVSQNLVRLFFRERVETFTGVLDHDSPHTGQYGLIKYNENEHVMDCLYGNLMQRYIDARVHHYTGITWDAFYHTLEFWETEEILVKCMKLAERDSAEAAKLQEQLNSVKQGK